MRATTPGRATDVRPSMTAKLMASSSNALDVDGFLTDEFGGTNFPLIHAVLRGPRIVPTPRLICDYARNGHMTHEEARTLLSVISPTGAGTTAHTSPSW